MGTRSVTKTFIPEAAMEGAGVKIRRAFPSSQLEDIDPFLLLDHLGPTDLNPGESPGFPDHPHRGFETVTYLLDGQMEHRDSFGNHGLIGPGDVQWMTAGSGLVHSEMPGAELVRNGGRLQGFQLWVNLPKRDKMAKPAYQELKSDQIPTGSNADGSVQVKVIAGKALGVSAAIQTHTPIQYLHFTLAPGASHAQPVPKKLNVFTYVVGGDLNIYAKDGDTVELRNDTPSTIDVLLIAGEPIGEPVARYGPFVMNSKEEVYAAFSDFRSGKMGVLA